jgi:hypothetical protein
MSRLDELPPDQRAALSLLLRQRKSYAEVASLLGIAEHAVHDRAHAALAVLASRRAREVAPERRLEIGDYLLGQQPGVAERLRTRTYLSSTAPARAWASELAAQLAPLAGGDLPEIPAGLQEPQRLQDLSSSPSSSTPSTAPSTAPVAGGSGAPATRALPSSRVGGAALLAVIVAVVVVAVVLLSGGGSNGTKSSATAGKGPSSGTSSTKTGPTIDNEIALKPPSAKSASVGVVDIVSEGSKRVFLIEAQHIPESKGFYYAIWLYNSPSSSLPLSRSPAVGSTHRLAGGAPLPSNAGDFHEILLTEETKSKPSHPGRVVLHGAFSLKS